MDHPNNDANPIYIVNVMGQTPQMIVFGTANETSPPPNERLKYSDQRIHPDDTIETIKRKILLELQILLLVITVYYQIQQETLT